MRLAQRALLRFLFGSVAAGVAVASCGGSDATDNGFEGGVAEAGAGDGNPSDATVGDDVSNINPDASEAGGDGATRDGASDACVARPNDPNNCGGCGIRCTGGQFCVGATCACPPYQKLCGGVCIPVSTDPNNCGGCGVVCAAGTACSSGVCSTGCIPGPMGGQPGLSICGRACVDKLNDNNNCGTCGNVCPANTGCVNGSCVPNIPVGNPPPRCMGAGPPIVVGGQCSGNVAQTVFRWALCSCKDISLTSSLFTDAYDSTQGPYPPNPLQSGAGVGLNGTFAGPVSNPLDIYGALWGSGTGGAATRSPSTVKQEAHIQGNLAASVGAFTIGDDTYVGGNVSATSSIAMARKLTLPTGATITGNVTSASIVRAPVTVPDPCDYCGSNKVPVAAIVAAQRGTNNDNAAVGLSATALATPGSVDLRLDLPCGYYYLTAINQPGRSVTIHAHGRTALFIDGDVVGQVVSFVLDPTGEFDVFVTGTIRTGGEFIIGSPNYPALSRTYVGGSAQFFLSGEAGRLGGQLYIGYAPVSATSHLILYGALYAGNFDNSENVDIHYDRNVLNVGCPPPPPPPPPDAGTSDGASGDGASSDGGPPPGCTTCRDCNNQACNGGTCGACTSSAQCCAPLTCIGGRCIVLP